MKEKCKKVLSILLSMAMLISITAGIDLSAYAMSSSGQCGENVTYTFDESTGLLTISGTGDMYDYDWNESPFYFKGVITVVIEDEVTSIGDGAFFECSNLTSVTIPNSVTSIGDGAFLECSSLTSITIPDSVKAIGDWAFEDCTSLTSVTIPNSVTSIGSSAFGNCLSLTSVTIPNSVTSIGYRAFSNCSSLRSVTIPNSVTNIGDWAFEACTSLMSVIIGNGVTNIGDCAFYECSSLTSITIPDSVKAIGDSAFYNCSSLTKITIGNNVTSIGDCAFEDCSSLKSVTIPNSVTSIGYRAFSNCSSLRSVTIPNSVTSIGDYAFYNCSSLTSVTIPDSVKTIGDYALCDCSSLTSITIPDSVKTIGDYAFCYCSSLTSATIGNSVTNIGDSAFIYCYNLTSITIPDSVMSVGDSAFYNCSSLKNINVSIENKNYSSSNGVLFDKNITKLIQYPIGNTRTIYTIPNSVSTISESAFYSCWNLKNITIPKSVKKIEKYAFHLCDNLINVYYTGSKTQWNNISIGSYNKPLINSYFHYNYVPPCDVCKNKKAYITKATASKDGSIDYKCARCGKKYKQSVVIPKASNIKLSATSYTYNGKVKTPSVTVKDSKGKTLKKNTDYTVTYDNGRKKIGKYAVKINFKGNYSGSKTLYFKIVPKGTSLTSVSATMQGFKVNWKKQAAQTTGYQIQYSTSKNFDSPKSYTTKNTKTLSKTFSKLSNRTTYYIRIRTYKKVGDSNYYSDWSKSLKVKTKGINDIGKVTFNPPLVEGLPNKFVAKWDKVSGVTGYQIKYTMHEFGVSQSKTVNAKLSQSKTSYAIHRPDKYDYIELHIRTYKTVKEGNKTVTYYGKYKDYMLVNGV